MTPSRERHILTETLHWQHITLSVSYEANWLNMPECPTAHLQVRSASPEREPLPITKTGYRSHFLPTGIVEAYESPADYVRQWLDEAMLSPAWQQFAMQRRQVSLF